MFQRVNSLLPHADFSNGYAAHHVANGSNGIIAGSGNGRAKAPAFTL